MLVDLRSDTVTRPTPGMLQAMMQAEVGDDVFGEDPTVNALEKKCAEMFGMDVAIFCPSGTMTNQIAINVLTQPYDEVVCYSGSHIYKYEGGGMAGNSLVNAKLLEAEQGVLKLDDIARALNSNDIHAAKTSLVALENTVNRGGGSYYSLEHIKSIASFCQKHQLKLHLDGARLFNALIETGDSPKAYGKYFDTISICLSKGLGAPVGSVLVCKKEYELAARRRRKTFGGGMRQAGFLAAAGIYALENNIQRLKADHQRAKQIASTLQQCNYVKNLTPVVTNILILELNDGLEVQSFLSKLRSKNILAVPFGSQHIRFVTHLDFTDTMLEYTVRELKALSI